MTLGKFTRQRATITDKIAQIFYSEDNTTKSYDEDHVILSEKPHKPKGYLVKVHCEKHDVIYEKTRVTLKKSKGCRVCNDKLLDEVRIDTFYKEFNKLQYSDEYKLLKPYVDSKTPIQIKHLVCGTEYYVLQGNLLKGKKCPSCCNIMYGITTLKDYQLKYESYHKERGYKLIEDNPYEKVNINTHIKLKHLVCGTILNRMSIGNFHRGRNCYSCSGRVSLATSIVEAILHVNTIEYQKEFTFDDCRNILPLPFDFKISTENSYFLLEIDGRQHYDTNSRFYSDDVSKRDKVKDDYCRDKDIELIRIRGEDIKTVEGFMDILKRYVDVDLKPNHKDVDKFNRNKLSLEDVSCIRQSYHGGSTTDVLMKEFSVSRPTICRILTYDTHSDILPELKKSIREKVKSSGKPPKKKSVLLPHKDEVLNLYNVDKMAYGEIAKRFNCTVSMVRDFIKTTI